MKDFYIYPAIVERSEYRDYIVEFPDIPNITTGGETLKETFLMAEDALKLYLFEAYENNEVIVEASDINEIETKANQTLILVKVDLMETIKEYDNKAVKKTLTIPSWLNKEAEREHINFSGVLQEALISRLNR